MNREIKFRAWIQGLKSIWAVEQIDFKYGRIMLMKEDTEGIGWIKLSQVELMQDTGLKDKNGKEIYEGDILKYHWQNPFKGQEAEGDAYFIAEWYEGSIIVRNLESYIKGEWGYGGQINFLRTEPETKYRGAASVEVIGNIYEDPDLLK